MAGRTHGMHAEPTTFGAKLALWCLQADRDRDRLRAGGEAVAVGKLSGAVGTYSNIDPAVEATCAAPRAHTRARHAGGRPRPPRRIPVGVRVGGRDRRDDRHRAPPPAAHRGGRGRGGVQAPGRRAARPCPTSATPSPAERLSGLARVLRGNLRCRARGRGPVARARHLPQLGGAGDPARRAPASPTTCCEGQRARADLQVDPSACASNLRGATAWCSASRCSSPWWRRGWRATTPTASCSDDARGVEQASPVPRCSRPTPRCTSRPKLDEAFSLERALRHVVVIFEALDVEVSLELLHAAGKVRDLYDVGDDRLLMVASDRMSAFDVVMAEPIPDKGRVLTAISAFWFERAGRRGAEPPDVGRLADCLPADARRELAGRVMLCGAPRCSPSSASCAATSGLGVEGVPGRRTVHGTPVPAGLQQADPLPEPMFTPSTKAAPATTTRTSRSTRPPTWWADERREGPRPVPGGLPAPRRPAERAGSSSPTPSSSSA